MMEKGITRIFEDKTVIETLGEGYKQVIEVYGRQMPDFLWKFPVPDYFSWDNSPKDEKTSKIIVKTEVNGEMKYMEIDQWCRKGHVWREIKIDGAFYTQEMWYNYFWDHGEMKKEIWIEWNRGEAKESIFVVEADGMKARDLFRRVKEMYGPPGFFWYKEITFNMSDHPGAKVYREILNPGKVPEGHYVCQDFGYKEWPSNFWVKMWKGSKIIAYAEKIKNLEGLTIIEWERVI